MDAPGNRRQVRNFVMADAQKHLGCEGEIASGRYLRNYRGLIRLKQSWVLRRDGLKLKVFFFGVVREANPIMKINRTQAPSRFKFLLGSRDSRVRPSALREERSSGLQSCSPARRGDEWAESRSFDATPKNVHDLSIPYDLVIEDLSHSQNDL